VTAEVDLGSLLCPTVSAGDVNRDGADDLFVPCGREARPEVYLQCGDGRFYPWPVSDPDDRTRFDDAGASAVVDFDRDGRLDLLVGSGNTVIAYRQIDELAFVPEFVWSSNEASKVSSLSPLPATDGRLLVYVTRLGVGEQVPGVPIPWASNLLLWRDGSSDWNRIELPDLALDTSERHTYQSGYVRSGDDGFVAVINDTGGPSALYPWDGSELSEALAVPDGAEVTTGMGLTAIALSDSGSGSAERLLLMAETGSIGSWALRSGQVEAGADRLTLDDPETHNYWGGTCGFFDNDSLPDCVLAEGVGGSDPERRAQFAADCGERITPRPRLHFLVGERSEDGQLSLRERGVSTSAFSPSSTDSFGTVRLARSTNLCDLLIVTPMPGLGSDTPIRVFETPCEVELGDRVGFAVSLIQPDWTVNLALDDGRTVSFDSRSAEGIGSSHVRARLNIGLGEGMPLSAQLLDAFGSEIATVDEPAVNRLTVITVGAAD